MHFLERLSPSTVFAIGEGSLLLTVDESDSQFPPQPKCLSSASAHSITIAEQALANQFLRAVWCLKSRSSTPPTHVQCLHSVLPLPTPLNKGIYKVNEVPSQCISCLRRPNQSAAFSRGPEVQLSPNG
jgi:hypothetical protein